jgi:O-antigen/teichoic acid export membrane protein
MFVVGLIMAIIAAALLFLVPYNPKELGFWPMVLGIFGIGLIAASNRKRLGQTQ